MNFLFQSSFISADYIFLIIAILCCILYFAILAKQTFKERFSEFPHTISAAIFAYACNEYAQHFFGDRILTTPFVLPTLIVLSGGIIFLNLKFGKEQSQNTIIKEHFTKINILEIIFLFIFFNLWNSTINNKLFNYNNVLIWSIINFSLSLNYLFLYLNKQKEQNFSKTLATAKLIISSAFGSFHFIAFPEFKIVEYITLSIILLDITYVVLLNKKKIYNPVNVSKAEFVYNSIFETLWARTPDKLIFHNYSLRKITHEDWLYQSKKSDYQSKIFLIEGNILLEVAQGNITTEDTINGLENIKSIIKQMNLSEYGFYYISDARKIKGASVGARQNVVDFNTNTVGMKQVYLVTSALGKTLFKLIQPISPGVFRKWKVESHVELCFDDIIMQLMGTNQTREKILGVFRNRKKDPIEERIDQLYDIMSKVSFNSFDKLPDLNIDPEDPFHDVFKALEVITNDKKELIHSLTEIIDNTKGALDKRNAQFRALFQNTTFQSGVFDENSILIDCNELFIDHYKRLGIFIKKGHNLNDFLREDEAINLLQSKKNALVDGYTEFEYKIEFPDGDIQWYRTKIFSVISKQKPNYFGFITENITEKINLRNQQTRLLKTLEVQNGKMKEFNHMLAHELNHHTASFTQLISSLNDPYLLEQNKDLIFSSLKTVNERLNISVDKMNVFSYSKEENYINENNTLSLPKHIYLIDDDSVSNALNKMIIQRILPDCKIEICINGKVAFDRLLKSDTLPDLILLDINMPVMNGWEFLEISNKHEISIDIHMLSSSQDPSEEEMSLVYPQVKSFVRKPLDSDKFNLIIEKSQKT